MNTKVIVKPNGWLESEIEVDAKIVLCAMRGGMAAIMEWGFRNRHIFPTTKKLTDRVFALKKQPEIYIQAVSEKAADLEKKYRSIIP
jgi:hypothetical protein